MKSELEENQGAEQSGASESKYQKIVLTGAASILCLVFSAAVLADSAWQECALWQRK